MLQQSPEKNKLFSTTFLSKPNTTSASLNHRKSLKWSTDEDNKLIELVQLYGNKNWKKIAEQMKTRNPVQCLHRWSKILQPGLVKGPWTVEEDRKLLQWVKTQGAMKWSMCSELIPGRSGKQCRERWYNNLNPDVIKGNWTAKEDYMIFKLFSIQGSKWSKIAEHFKGRTENSIKNRFYSTLRRISSKYNNNTHQGGNLDSLLEYFPIALKEKEGEYNKENEDLSKMSSTQSTSNNQNDTQCSVTNSPETKSIKEPIEIKENLPKQIEEDKKDSFQNEIPSFQEQVNNSQLQYMLGYQNNLLLNNNNYLMSYYQGLNYMLPNYYKSYNGYIWQ